MEHKISNEIDVLQLTSGNGIQAINKMEHLNSSQSLLSLRHSQLHIRILASSNIFQNWSQQSLLPSANRSGKYLPNISGNPILVYTNLHRSHLDCETQYKCFNIWVLWGLPFFYAYMKYFPLIPMTVKLWPFNIDTYIFEAREIKFLGHVIDKDRISTLQEKAETIHHFPHAT